VLAFSTVLEVVIGAIVIVSGYGVFCIIKNSKNISYPNFPKRFYTNNANSYLINL